MEHERADIDIAGQDLGQLAELFRKRNCVGVWVEEEERWPGVGARGNEGELGLVEAGLALGARRAAQRTVEFVRPRVIVALDRAALATALGEHGAAVSAHVEERAQLAVGIAGDDDRNAPRV